MRTSLDIVRLEQNLLKILLCLALSVFFVLPIISTIYDVFFTDRAHFRETTSFSNLYQLEHGLKEYASENDGRLPTITSEKPLVKVLYPKFVPATQPFQSPLTETDYLFNRSLSGKRISSLPGHTVVIYAPSPSRRHRYNSRLGRCVLYANGKPGWVWEDDWLATKIVSQIR